MVSFWSDPVLTTRFSCDLCVSFQKTRCWLRFLKNGFMFHLPKTIATCRVSFVRRLKLATISILHNTIRICTMFVSCCGRRLCGLLCASSGAAWSPHKPWLAGFGNLAEPSLGSSDLRFAFLFSFPRRSNIVRLQFRMMFDWRNNFPTCGERPI